jgi:hypothetical protein
MKAVPIPGRGYTDPSDVGIPPRDAGGSRANVSKALTEAPEYSTFKFRAPLRALIQEIPL